MGGEGGQREEKGEEKEDDAENGPAHQLAFFMRRDTLLPQKAAYRTPHVEARPNSHRRR
jgi:hypothetical protein